MYTVETTKQFDKSFKRCLKKTLIRIMTDTGTHADLF